MQLRITEEDRPPVVFHAPGPEVTIGRREGNDLVLTQSFVSGHHARLFAGTLVEDLDSRNGTFVDGVRIEAPALLPKGVFSVGGQSLSIEVIMTPEDGMAAALRGCIADLRANASPPETPRDHSPVASDESALLGSLVAMDFESAEIPAQSTATDAYIFEAFQFIRNAERIISKLAGGLTNELKSQTILPDADKNFRKHMAELLVQRNDPAARAELHQYLNKVFEWLYAAVHCYQKGALGVVQELKGQLERGALKRGGSLPWYSALPGLERALLWDRAQAQLEDWTQSHAIDRLEAQVNAAAKAFRMANDFEDL